jgi:hypothetical protein
MLQIHEYLNAFGDDVVRFLSLDVSDKSDSAGVSFIEWIIQTLDAGVSIYTALFFH